MNDNPSIKFFLPKPILSILTVAILGISSCAFAPLEANKVTNLSSKNSSTATNRSDRVTIFCRFGN